MLNVPICTQGMQRTWWPEAGTVIVTGPYWLGWIRVFHWGNLPLCTHTGLPNRHLRHWSFYIHYVSFFYNAVLLCLFAWFGFRYDQDLYCNIAITIISWSYSIVTQCQRVPKPPHIHTSEIPTITSYKYITISWWNFIYTLSDAFVLLYAVSFSVFARNDEYAQSISTTYWHGAI